ncbi:MAG: orotidine-5'-phosphate decarboxylase [Acidimicrobiales bacterium]|jgi:orotidine-5'-phosphate decarboxylase
MNREGTSALSSPDEQARAARGRLALALDVPDSESARRLARRLAPWFAVAKVGLELFVAEGPDIVRALVDEGFEVFLDLKLHDIPSTVGRAASRAASTGAKYVTVHSAGGEAMLRAAVDGYRSGGRPPVDGAGILGVTVLTSDPSAPEGLLRERAQLAERAGCAGLVCAAGDLAVVSSAAPLLKTVVPGIRLPGAGTDDQARTATPAAALAMGADLLVIGRTVTRAEDPEAAATLVAAEVARADARTS